MIVYPYCTLNQGNFLVYKPTSLFVYFQHVSEKHVQGFFEFNYEMIGDGEATYLVGQAYQSNFSKNCEMATLHGQFYNFLSLRMNCTILVLFEPPLVVKLLQIKSSFLMHP